MHLIFLAHHLTTVYLKVYLVGSVTNESRVFAFSRWREARERHVCPAPPRLFGPRGVGRCFAITGQVVGAWNGPALIGETAGMPAARVVKLRSASWAFSKGFDRCVDWTSVRRDRRSKETRGVGYSDLWSPTRPCLVRVKHRVDGTNGKPAPRSCSSSLTHSDPLSCQTPSEHSAGRPCQRATWSCADLSSQRERGYGSFRVLFSTDASRRA
jgi:hypothetical protein